MSFMTNFYNSKIELGRSDFSFKNLQSKPVLTKEKGKHRMYVVYATWCPHCSDPEFRKRYTALADKLREKNVHLYAVNSTNEKMGDIAEGLQVSGFPTIRYVAPNGKEEDYEGARDMISMANFILKKKK